MALRTWRPAVFAATLVLVALTASPAQAGRDSQNTERGDPASVPGETAVFDGATINLAEGWGGATACMVWAEASNTIECFSSEAELDARVLGLETELGLALGLATSAKGGGPTESLMAVNCSSYLKLYDGTWYSGAILYLRSKYLWHNLSSYGFNQRASSYKMGACNAYFADYSNGGGAWYPTYATQAWDQMSSMYAGWNNDVSSVYIF